MTDIICPLCLGSAKTDAPFGPTPVVERIECPKCGTYQITDQASETLRLFRDAISEGKAVKLEDVDWDFAKD